MESPSHLSEVNLRRYKGIRASKKSLYSCVDYYTKDDEALGPRSVSLTALATEAKRPHSVIEPSRMSRLQTVEQNMANIEVSLGLRRKRNGMLGTTLSTTTTTTPASTRSIHSTSSLQGNNPNSNHSNPVTITNVNGGGGVMANSIPCVLNGSTTTTTKPNPKDWQAQKEMECLKQSIKDKENLILNLQGQLRKLAKRKVAHGSITSTDSGVVSLRVLSESERKAAEDRLSQLDKDMEVKRMEIKRINHRLERLDPSDNNIDVRIYQAELEYDLEREELNLMNLQEERRNLHIILDDNDVFQRKTENSLFSTLSSTSAPENTQPVMYAFEVVHNPQDPGFTVGKRDERPGTYVTWTRDDLKTLKRGDRVMEINGTLVVSKSVSRVEEFWLDEDNSGEDNNVSGGSSGSDNSIGSHPLRLVVTRTPPPPPPPRVPNRELHMLKEELSLVTAKLEQVSLEKKELHSLCQKIQKEQCLWEEENEKVRDNGEKIAKERDILKAESVRLKHRISYLEEQVTDLLQRKEVHPSQSVTVFQKGNHKTIVAEPIKPTAKDQQQQLRSSSPSRAPSVASTRTTEHRQALKTRLWETFRRATTSDSRSVCSVESSKPNGENGYFKKRFSESKKSKVKPEPPTKPIRLSLQRATSTSNVYSHGMSGSDVPEMNPGLRRSNYSENTLMPDWVPPPPPDHLLGSSGESGERNKKQHGIRWPSLRPASSMSYTMGNRSRLAKF